MSGIHGLIFDKDGTLFDFRATWSAWARQFFMELSAGSETLAARLGQAVGFNMEDGTFVPDSPIIAGTPAEISMHLLEHVPGADRATLVARMNAVSAETRQVAAVPLVPLFEGFTARGLKLGLATNDAEEPATAHLRQAGVASFFHFVSGYDSGYGAKPDPGPLLAFARMHGLAPGTVAMVGDSLHDLIAGRAAGMRTVAVLTGIAGADALSPLADVVLTDIGHLPDWIDSQAMAET
ncbi:MAG: HAD family hydrolase [Albidovulum sp.]|uniref:HAD family hydrolase n=1 Tax=Albidovulum sp. TaxID=1872424 RepID=UPI003CAA863F